MSKNEELHNPSIAPATPEHAFDDATLDAPAERAVELAKKTPANRQEALVQAWLARRNAAAIAEISRADDAPSAARKAARRALGVLKSRGITVPERGPVVANLAQKAPATFEARFLFPDAKGAQLWWIAKVEKTGRTEVVEVTTVDRMGIIAVNRGTPTMGNLKQVWQQWQARTGRMPVEVPVDFARWRIANAKKTSEARKQVLPLGLDASKELLGDPSPTAPKHPIELEDLAIPSEENAVKARLEKSMHLHEEPEFGPWLPDDSAAVELLQTVTSRVNGLPEDQRKDQAKIDVVVNAALDEAADAYFNDERKAIYGSRLFDAAWSLYRAGVVDRAIDAMLVGRAIAKAGIVSDRPSEIPFVRGMFLKVLAIAQQRAGAMAPRGNEEAARLQGEG